MSNFVYCEFCQQFKWGADCYVRDNKIACKPCDFKEEWADASENPEEVRAAQADDFQKIVQTDLDDLVRAGYLEKEGDSYRIRPEMVALLEAAGDTSAD